MGLFVAGAFAGGFTVGIAGFGAGPVALAAWLHILPPSIAAPVLALCVGIAQFQSFMVVRQSFGWQRVWPFLAGGLVGVPAGAVILLYVSGDILSRLIGGFLIVYALIFIVARNGMQMTKGGRPADAAAGFGAGIACGAASLPGPPMSIWCNLRGWSKDIQRATAQPFNISMVIVVAMIYAWNGLITANVIGLALIALPAIALGARLGVLAYRRINEAQYRTLLLFMLLASGLALVWPG
jgi:hypothetical protein